MSDISPAHTITSVDDDANSACIFSCADMIKKSELRVHKHNYKPAWIYLESPAQQTPKACFLKATTVSKSPTAGRYNHNY
jgi:hypothetical protein